MSNKLVLIGALVLLGAGTLAFYTLRKPATEPATAASAPGPERPAILPMESFLFNINDPRGDRMAKVTVQLTVLPPSAAEAIGRDEILQAKMRDRVLTLLTSKAANDLLDTVGKEALRREIKAGLTPLLQQGQIQDVLFSDFVVQ